MIKFLFLLFSTNALAAGVCEGELLTLLKQKLNSGEIALARTSEVKIPSAREGKIPQSIFPKHRPPTHFRINRDTHPETFGSAADYIQGELEFMVGKFLNGTLPLYQVIQIIQSDEFMPGIPKIIERGNFAEIRIDSIDMRMFDEVASRAKYTLMGSNKNKPAIQFAETLYSYERKWILDPRVFPDPFLIHTLALTLEEYFHFVQELRSFAGISSAVSNFFNGQNPDHEADAYARILELLGNHMDFFPFYADRYPARQEVAHAFGIRR